MALVHVIGIDPGLAGGVARVDVVDGIPTSATILGRTPALWVTKRNGIRRREYDVHAMVHLLRDAVGDKYHAIVALEQGGPRPSQGLASTYRTGMGVGLWHGLIAALGCSLVLIHPSVWKRVVGLIGAEKRASRLKAVERFPGLGVLGPADEGGAEAVLIALAAVAVLETAGRQLRGVRPPNGAGG